MTEITDTKESKVTIHLGDFLLALFGSPILIALLFFWVFLIPVFAVFLGGIPWLIFGGPAFWLTLRYLGPSPMLIGSALVAHVLGTPLYVLFVLPSLRSGFLRLGAMHDLESMLMWGGLFSTIWGTVFWLSYRSMAKARTRRRPQIPA